MRILAAFLAKHHDSWYNGSRVRISATYADCRYEYAKKTASYFPFPLYAPRRQPYGRAAAGATTAAAVGAATGRTQAAKKFTHRIHDPNLKLN